MNKIDLFDDKNLDVALSLSELINNSIGANSAEAEHRLNGDGSMTFRTLKADGTVAIEAELDANTVENYKNLFEALGI